MEAIMRIMRDDQPLVIEDGEVSYYIKLIGIGPNTIAKNSPDQLPAIISGINGFYLSFKKEEDIKTELNKIIDISVKDFKGE